MTGTFGCTLNFGTTPTVSNFALSVTGANYAASISEASGTLSTTGNNHINLDYTSGAWQLGPTGSPVSATYGDAKGSVYGTNGEAVGGVWKMGEDVYYNYHATGVYQGTKVVE